MSSKGPAMMPTNGNAKSFFLPFPIKTATSGPLVSEQSALRDCLISDDSQISHFLIQLLKFVLYSTAPYLHVQIELQTRNIESTAVPSELV